MAKIIKKRYGKCEIKIEEINGRVIFKCKNRKSSPTAQEIIDSVKNRRIILR